MSDMRIGQQLGSYRLTRLLGKGGFAEVYLGEHVNNSKELVAIKVVDTTLTDQTEMDNFVNEWKKLASLTHPHIVKILGSNIQGNIAYLVMKYAPNGTLAQKHKDKLPLPFPTIERYVKEIASALQYLHERGLVHCDVKPDNLLLEANDEVILGDFGIVTPTRTAATTLEHIAGTAPYMAPEQIKGKPVRASDQYSLGIMIYQWLTGELPFRGTLDAIYQQHQSTDPPPMLRNGARISLSIERVVRKALEKEPNHRYPTIHEFANALENAFRVTHVAPQLTNPPFPQAPNGQSPDGVLHISSAPGYEGAPGDLTVQDSPVLHPIPSTPPGLPVHPLILKQYEILTRFQALQDGYVQRQGEQLKQHNQKMQEASAKQSQSLVKVQQMEQAVSQRINELDSNLRVDNWDGFIVSSGRLMSRLQLLKPSAYLQIRSLTDYAEKMASYQTLMNKLIRKISIVPGFYKRPQYLVYTCTAVAGVIVLLLLILLNMHFPVFNIYALFFALLGFVVISLLCLYPQAFLLNDAYMNTRWIKQLVQEAYEQECEVIEKAYEQEMAWLETKYAEDKKGLEQSLRNQMSEPLSAFDTFKHDLGFTGAEWRDRNLWDQWKPALHQQIPITRIGSLTFDLSTGPIVLPALMSCPLGCNIVFQVEGTAKDRTVSAIQSLILRLLASQQPGKVHFTIIDPEKLGGNVKPFFSLPNAASILGTEGPWYHNQDIKQQLRKLIDLIAQRKNIEGPVESYHVLVVMDFPTKFTPEAADDLLRIARNGPPCGVSTILVVDIAQALTTFDQQLQSLEKGSTVITWDGESQQFFWQDSPFQSGRLTLDVLPLMDSSQPYDLLKRILQTLIHEVQAATSLERNLFNLPGDKLTLGNSISGKGPTTLTFRHRSDSNLLIIGKEEETALDMLTNAILNRVLHDPQAQTRFYAVDPSLGDGIEKYENNVFELLRQKFPAYFAGPVVRFKRMRDDLPGLLSHIANELKEREEGSKTVSPLYLFFYGLQFAENILQKGSSRDATESFSYILRKGSRLGIHTLMWSDKCSSLEAIFGSGALDYFDHRVALHMSSREDAAKVLERTDAGIPGQKQAFFFSRGTDGFEKFQPYSIPSQEWLQLAITKIQS